MNNMQAEAIAAVIVSIRNTKRLLDILPNSREKSITLTKLDEAEMWFNKIPAPDGGN